MSRIGARPITIPETVTVSLTDTAVQIKGPKGELNTAMQKGITVSQEGAAILVKRHGNDRFAKAYHGLMNRLITNMIIGVTEGYTKKLELVGTGYRAKVQGKGVVISAGFSHPVEFTPPEGVAVTTETDTVIVVSGRDKQAVGQAAANLRCHPPPRTLSRKGHPLSRRSN
jgi:large subunit ribosomal protein L6